MKALCDAAQLVLYRLDALAKYRSNLISGKTLRVESGHAAFFIRYRHLETRLADNTFKLAHTPTRTLDILEVHHTLGYIEVQRVMLCKVAPDEQVNSTEVVEVLVRYRICSFFTESLQRLRKEPAKSIQDELDNLAIVLRQATLLAIHTVAHFAIPQVELYCLHVSPSTIGCRASNSVCEKGRRPAILSLMVR